MVKPVFKTRNVAVLQNHSRGQNALEKQMIFFFPPPLSCCFPACGIYLQQELSSRRFAVLLQLNAANLLIQCI